MYYNLHVTNMHQTMTIMLALVVIVMCARMH